MALGGGGVRASITVVHIQEFEVYKKYHLTQTAFARCRHIFSRQNLKKVDFENRTLTGTF